MLNQDFIYPRAYRIKVLKRMRELSKNRHDINRNFPTGLRKINKHIDELESKYKRQLELLDEMELGIAQQWSEGTDYV